MKIKLMFKTALVSVLAMVLTFGNQAFGQNRSISGTVTDQSGQPVIGAAVVVKGTTNGTSTGLDGKWQLSVQRGSTLVVSSIGYVSQEFIMTEKAVYDMVLAEDNQMIEETVVVGYGVQRKSDITGAISSVKSADIENRTVTEVSQALQGKTAGVLVLSSSGAPGSNSTVRVRGYSSNGSSDPLYVVDGLRVSSITNIDPNDIESVEVLKDAASAAIYGAQAGNGVILVTTKRAKKGITKVSYDMQMTYQTLSHSPKMMNASEYINYMTEANYITQESLGKYYDGKTDIDWMKEMFSSGVMSRHNVSFQKAAEGVSVYASAGYLSNDGMVIGDKDSYSRLTASLNAEVDIFKWLKFGTSNQFGKMKTKSAPSATFTYIFRASPIIPITYSSLPSYMASSYAGYESYLLKDKSGNYYSTSPYGLLENPYATLEMTDSDNEGTILTGSTYLDFKPLAGLVITSRLGYRMMNFNSYTTTMPHATMTDTKIPYWTVNASDMTQSYWQWENFANFTKTFANKHNLNLMAGMSFSKDRQFDVTGAIQGSSTNLGITKNDANYAYFAYATGAASKTLSGGEAIYSTQLSYFGRASYDYMNKYFVQASLRADAADTSILPVNKRWGYFPAVSLGWQISNEDFMKQQNAISHLKIRASWGQNGSIAGLSDYMYDAVMSSASTFYSFDNQAVYHTGTLPTSTGNYDLKWETSEQYDLGVDVRLLKDKLSFTADYFIKNTKDLIISNYTPSYIVGVTASPINAGSVRNQGLELEVSWKDHFGDFNYNISGNIATLKNRVTSISSYVTRITAGSNFTGDTNAFEPGYPLWYLRGYKYIGVAPSAGYYKEGTASTEGNGIYYAAGNAMYSDIDNDNNITENDKTYIGSGIPDFTYGLTANVSWKNWDLVIFGTGSHGADILYTNNGTSRVTGNKWKEFYDGRWTAANTNSRYPRPVMQNDDQFNNSSAMMYDGSYFKIKQIQLGYSVPKACLKKIHLSNVRIYASLDDFITFTNYPGFDPELVSTGSSMGLDSGYYPSSKKVVFGLNVTF